jgi:hypothetical protein
LKKIHFFLFFASLSLFSFLCLLFPLFFYLTQEHLVGAPSTRTERPNHLGLSPLRCCSVPPSFLPNMMQPPPSPYSSLPPSLPLPRVPIADHGASTPAMAVPSMEIFNQGHFSLWHNQNGCARPSSCYLRPQFYLKPTLISVFHVIFFKRKSDFISNSNFNPSGLLPQSYISLGEPPPRISMPILTQNRTLVHTRAPPPLSVPLIAAISIPNINLVSVVRSQKPNSRRKNQVESRSVASAIYR